MIVKIGSASLWGLDGFPVTVEAYFGGGLPETEMIGLPDTAVKESLNRIRAAAHSLGLPLPRGAVTVSLAPADRKKVGSGFDLPILIALLCGTVLKEVDLSGTFFFGELGLDGALRPGAGALCRALAAKRAGARRLFCPAANVRECSAVDGVEVYGAESVGKILDHLFGRTVLPRAEFDRAKVETDETCEVDFADIKGQAVAKRAMEIAAAGGHNILLVGPPGSGKSMLSHALPGILPAMRFEEMLEVTAIHSVAGVLPENATILSRRPFRAPHHTLSLVGLAGGGQVPQPGEISLAHHGVLFLDELPEFAKKNLEVLRQPLEDGKITITRANWKETFPSDFMLVCAMNPCPCGYFGDETHRCRCTKAQVQHYIEKISGPLLDRIDMRVEVPAVPFEALRDTAPAESSRTVRERVNTARALAAARYQKEGVTKNGALSAAQTKKYCTLTPAAEDLLREMFQKLNLSARGHDRILRLARTIADLAGAEDISDEHLFEAVQYRVSTEKYFE